MNRKKLKDKARDVWDKSSRLPFPAWLVDWVIDNHPGEEKGRVTLEATRKAFAHVIHGAEEEDRAKWETIRLFLDQCEEPNT